MITRPMLTAPDTARTLEAVAATAKTELLLCLPRLDPRTPLVRAELRNRGIEDWGDLVGWITRRGVALRMLVPDVDPLARPEAHRAAWTRASGFADVVQGNAQILCASHGHAATGLRAWRLNRPRKATLAALRAQDPGRLTPVQRAAPGTTLPARVAEIGQAFVLADGAGCVLGGPLLGTATEGPAPSALHVDDADFCGALRGHFADAWAAAIATGSRSLAAPAAALDLPRRAQSRADLRLIRTLSRPSRGLAPAPQVTDHEAALARMVDAATTYILIRTEALRHDTLADRLASAARRAEALQLVLLLPPLAPADPWDDARARHLQASALDRLRAAFGDRMALCADPAPGGTLCLVDDRDFLVGSAALTRRACRWNTEASALVQDPSLARQLMDSLAAVLLPGRGLTAEALRSAAVWSARLPAPESVTASRPARRRLPDDLF
ncbi:phospholipase D-like domain-containing protein [Maliponia aquimaris]|uniref:Phospholipase D-like domain-containing protein n=1 Tax=Maliponia aquimaris TaxID=1673631 RepID=A0A238KAG8_9RHOB|nr:phospholipase D-like domain-containing protein [Maliponia aquimaris]SMX38976.1 hypothetical protein MAA8898_01815 [Maliponia aquimaris]